MTDPQNPNRLAGSPALGEPALGLQPVAVVERSPTGLALLPQYAVKVGIVLMAVAGFIIALPTMGTGIVLPPVVTGIAAVVVAIGGALGLASPGLRKAPGTQPVTLAQPSNNDVPRIGPPV